MEYKYKMLNPPHSTESIDFKLSETYLENCLLLSPQKAQDSLTYTVSMETIQDHESPFKGLGHHFFHSSQKSMEFENSCEQRKATEPFSLNSYYPIISIKIQPEELEQSNKTIQKEAIEIRLQPENQNKSLSSFCKKNVVHVTNLKLQTISEQAVEKKSTKMGKVMTRIHSLMKQNRSITRSRIASRKTLQSPTHESIQSQGRAHSQKKNENQKARYQNQDRINENTILVENLSQIKCNQSKLSKTNASSNEAYSPEIIRRKSDYCGSKVDGEGSHLKKPLFLSDRSAEGGGVKKFKTFKNKNSTSRDRIHSAFVGHKRQADSQTITLKPQQKYGMWRNPKEQIRTKETDKAKILDRLKQNEVHLTSSILISSLKPNFSDRGKENTSKYSVHNKLVSNFMVDENSVNSLEINKQSCSSPRKQKQCSFLLNNVQVNASIAMKGINNKKGWRKIKQNLPKRVFCV